MKAFLGWVVVLAVLAGSAGYGIYSFHGASQKYAYALAIGELKRDFLRESVGLSLLDGEAYRKEIGIHLTRYFTRLGKLAKEYPGQFDPERARLEGKEQLDKGIISEAHLQAREERIDLVSTLMDQMRSGQYRPLYTAVDKGFRFDICDIKLEKISGEPRVKVAFAHWGAFGPVSYNTIIGNIRAKQEKGKPVEIPQIVGEGQPPSLQVDPETWISEFVPGVEVGYYDLPLFPSESEGVQLSFDFGIRTVGGSELTAAIKFPEIPIPNEWKIGEGEKWRAQERIASDEELLEAGAKAAN